MEENNENSYLNKRIKKFKKDAKKSIIFSLINIFSYLSPFIIYFLFAGSRDLRNTLILVILSIFIFGPLSIISNIVILIFYIGITKIKNNKEIIILYVFVLIGLFLSLIPYLILLLQYINE